MASEIRVDKINSLSGVGTVTLSPTGVDIAGITTAATLRATTGIVTSLTAGSLTSLGDITANGGDMTISGASAILHLIDTNDNPNYRVQNIGGAFQVYDATNETARLSIASGGAATFGGAVSGTTGTFTNGILLNDNISHIDNTNTKIRFPSNNNFSVEVNGSEGFRVSPSGTTVTTTTDASFFVNTTNSSGSHIRLQTSGTTKTYFGQAQGISGTLGGADDFGVMSAGKINFGTNGSATKRLEIETGGDVKVSTGDLYFGTAGKGIVLGATSNTDANTLDDYEEGTWTPTVNGTNSNLTHRASRYLKIGKLVQLQVEFYTTAGNFSTGANLNLTNLPFLGPEAHPSHVVGSVSYMNSAYGMTLMTNYMNSSSQWYFSQATGSGLYLWANITYHTNS